MSEGQKEFRLQVFIIKKHFEYFGHVLITHIPNRPANAADGFFKKAMGVRAGVSDIALWWMPDFLTSKSKHYGLKPMQAGMVELKVDTKVSGAQNKWLSAFDSCGGYQGVARSWKEYYKLLCSWGIKPRYPCAIFDEPVYATKEEKFKAVHEMYKP